MSKTIIIIGAGLAGLSAALQAAENAVSYTHLDVYKRQCGKNWPKLRTVRNVSMQQNIWMNLL